MASVEQHLLVSRNGSEMLEHRLEGALVQRGRQIDDRGHCVISSPRRWRVSPAAPRKFTLRAAAACAARIAMAMSSPARRREKYVAPHTSPQPVGSPLS